MHSITRREALRLGCGSLAVVPDTASYAAGGGRLFEGCLLTAVGYEQYRTLVKSSIGDGLIARNRYGHTTGDPAIDRDLDRALGVVADLFGVNPAFGFYDPAKLRNPVGIETNGMNAFAAPDDTDIPGTRGTVGFGWNLFLQEFYQYDNSGLTLMAIVAHEFGSKTEVLSQRLKWGIRSNRKSMPTFSRVTSLENVNSNFPLCNFEKRASYLSALAEEITALRSSALTQQKRVSA